jgi:hypothetical protein
MALEEYSNGKTFQTQIEEEEDVMVPAGTFKCLKIVEFTRDTKSYTWLARDGITKVKASSEVVMPGLGKVTLIIRLISISSKPTMLSKKE